MANDLACGKGAQAPADRKVAPLRIAIEETGSIKVARAGCVNKFAQPDRINRMNLISGEQHRSLLAARQGRHLALTAQLPQRLIEIIAFEKRHDLHLISEEQVHIALYQIAEGLAVTVNAEGVRERQGNLGASGAGAFSRLHEGLLGPRAVPKIALEIEDPGTADQSVIDIFRAQFNRNAEIGRHGALRIRRDKDQTARSGRPRRRSRIAESN